MKTVARYLYPFYADAVDFDGSLVSNLIKPAAVAVNNFIGYDPTEEVGDGLLPAADQVFARRILTQAASMPAQQYTVTQMLEFATRAGSYFAIEKGNGDTELIFIVDINDPIYSMTNFTGPIPGSYNIAVNADNTISITLNI